MDTGPLLPSALVHDRVPEGHPERFLANRSKNWSQVLCTGPVKAMTDRWREYEAQTGKKPGGHDPKVSDAEHSKPDSKAERNWTATAIDANLRP